MTKIIIKKTYLFKKKKLYVDLSSGQNTKKPPLNHHLCLQLKH